MAWADENLPCFEPPDEETEMYDKIVHQTEKAILFQQGKYKFWLPKSIITEMNENSVSFQDVIEIDFFE